MNRKPEPSADPFEQLISTEFGDRADPEELLTQLEASAGAMAERALAIFMQVFPEAASWDDARRAEFVTDSTSRFEAIIQLTRDGALDDEVAQDLAEIGETAALGGASLPEVLIALRVSRDLVVQTAVELSETQAGQSGLALSLVLTQVLPAVDMLTDAIARGYWAAIVARETADHERYRSIVEHSSDGFFDIDGHGVLRFANVAFCRQIGAAGHVVGQPVDEIMPIDGGIARYLPPPGGQVVETVQARRADGVERTFELRIGPRRPSPSESSEPGDGGVGHTVVVRDITEGHRLAVQKNHFIEAISHELRAPLETFLSFSNTLVTQADDMNPDRSRSIGEALRRPAERMARLVDDLADLSRIGTHDLTIQARPASLRSVVEDASNELPDIDLPVSIDIDPKISVMVDPARARQVFANLIENAFDHGAPPVVVAARADGAFVEIDVTDFGEGVPPHRQGTMFEQFGATPHVGLPLVRGLVEAMGGRVWYEDEAAPGACFRLTLPLA